LKKVVSPRRFVLKKVCFEDGCSTSMQESSRKVVLGRITGKVHVLRDSYGRARVPRKVVLDRIAGKVHALRDLWACKSPQKGCFGQNHWESARFEACKSP
jgi:hypothetical protein